MRRALVLSALLLAVLGGGLGFVYSGIADVAATSPAWPLTEWLLSTTKESSVRRHARTVTAPPYLDEAEHVRAGARAYDAMCVSCHGAPGIEPGVAGKGLNPAPPDLAEEADEWRPEELYWITAHGVRMTGMPAFAPTHSDEELWDLVALLVKLPELSHAEYRELAPEHAAGHGHGHAHSHEHTHEQAP